MSKQDYIIIPRGKWILVKPLSENLRETEHGLLLPANEEKEQKAQGTVEAVGKEVKDIKVGDQVIYGAFAGEDIRTRKGTSEVLYKIMLDEDVIAFIK